MTSNRPPARPAAPARPRADRNAKKNSSLVPWLVAGVVVILGLVGLWALLGDSGSDSSGSNEVADVKITGESLPSTGGASGPITPSADPAVGKTVPALTGSTPTGSAITFAAGGGKPAVYIFAAHWCPHCQAELPRVQKWLNDGSLPKTVEYRTVSTSVNETRGNFPPSAWFDRIKWTNPVMVDSKASQAAQAFGLESFPYMLFVDANGVVKQRATGEIGLDAWKAGIALIAPNAG
jgi:cytochrome c biogenesis protein CcmG/thiol:disulfide interchange protein DsbE